MTGLAVWWEVPLPTLRVGAVDRPLARPPHHGDGFTGSGATWGSQHRSRTQPAKEPTMPATSLSRPNTEVHYHERWITAPTDVVRITAWHDPIVETMPGAIPTASDEMLVTGRVRIFVSCECLSGGAW